MEMMHLGGHGAACTDPDCGDEACVVKEADSEEAEAKVEEEEEANVEEAEEKEEEKKRPTVAESRRVLLEASYKLLVPLFAAG